MKFSICGHEILKFKKDILTAKKLIGKSRFIRNSSEDNNKIFRRSIYVIKDIKKGEKFTTNNLKILRPALGLKPKYFPKVLGKISTKEFKKNTLLTLNIK